MESSEGAGLTAEEEDMDSEYDHMAVSAKYTVRSEVTLIVNVDIAFAMKMAIPTATSMA